MKDFLNESETAYCKCPNCGASVKRKHSKTKCRTCDTLVKNRGYYG